ASRKIRGGDRSLRLLEDSGFQSTRTRLHGHLKSFEVHCVTCSSSIKWRATHVPSDWATARLLRNNVVDRQGRYGRGVSFDSCKHTKSTDTRIGAVQSQEESSEDSERAWSGGDMV